MLTIPCAAGAGTVMTAIGQDLLPNARRILEEFQGLIDKTESVSRGPGGTYRLGVTPTLGPYLLPHILPALHKRYGSLKLSVREDAPRDLETALADEFRGTNAVVFAYGDASAPAKALTEFGKTVEELVIKTGAMDGKAMDEAQIKFLSTLPGKDELRAMLLGTLQAPMVKLVRTMNEVPTGVVRVLAARKEQLDKEA